MQGAVSVYQDRKEIREDLDSLCSTGGYSHISGTGNRLADGKFGTFEMSGYSKEASLIFHGKHLCQEQRLG